MDTHDVLKRLRSDAESFYSELSWEFYLEGAGLKDRVNLSEIYDKYSHLADVQLVKMLHALLMEETNPSERRRIINFLEMVVQTHLENRTKRYTDQILQTEISGIIEWGKLDKHRASFRESYTIMTNESDRKVRKQISEARDRFVAQELNPIYEQMFSVITDRVEELGYYNYAHMVEKLSGISLRNLNTEMQRFLEATNDMYRELFGWTMKKKVNISVGNIERHDVLHVMRGKEFDHYFPSTTMLETIAGFIKSMRIDPFAGGNIQFDVDRREMKSPRAFCVMVRVPHEIYLVIQPVGGEEDYQAILHELGHALHYGYTRPDLPFEFKRLGDNSVTEGYAITFDHLTMNPLWLEKVLHISYDPRYVRHRMLNELIILRRYAAKIRYELQLHDGRGHVGKDEIYQETLSAATLTNYSGVHYLSDVDPFFYSARYLRAWMLEAILSEYLVENFERDWFINPRTGEFLVDLWRYGQSVTAEELATMLGGGRLSVDPLIRRFERAFD